MISPAIAHAGIDIFLYPRIHAAEGEVYLRDIGKIEGDENELEAIEGMRISPELYRDGLIDRREVYQLVSAVYKGSIVIYGSAVRIVIAEKGGKDSLEPVGDGAGVKAGDSISLVVRNKGLVLQMTGKALDSGVSGDRVWIMLKGSKRIRGVVTGKGMAEVDL